LPPPRPNTITDARTEGVEAAMFNELTGTLRRRYRCPVAYAGRDPEVRQLLHGDKIHPYYCWRLSSTARDRFGDLVRA
jgi:hypothetical protein